MTFGMTYEQFWDGDVWMAKAYRQAYELRKERENFNAWLQGLYIYDAICDASPILRAFSKARKPNPYPSKPYDLNTVTSKNRKNAAAEKRRMAEDDIFVANMNAWAESFNKRFLEKQEKTKAQSEADGNIGETQENKVVN